MYKPRQIISSYFYFNDISVFLVMIAIILLNVLAETFPKLAVLTCLLPVVIWYVLRRNQRYDFIDKYRHHLSDAFVSLRMQIIWGAWLLMVSSTTSILIYSSFHVWLMFFMIYFFAGLCKVAAARYEIYRAIKTAG